MPILRINIEKAVVIYLLYYWYLLVLCQRSSGGQKQISVTKKYLLHIICDPCTGSELRHKVMGRKPMSLIALVSQRNHEIKLIDTKVNQIFSNEVRWTQVHVGYTQSLLWDSVTVADLPCPTCCTSIGFTSHSTQPAYNGKGTKCRENAGVWIFWVF